MYNPTDRGRAPEGREAVGRNSRLAVSALKQLRKPGSRREKLGWAQSGGRSTERESNLRRGNSEVLPNEPQFGETEAGRCVEERTRVDLSSWSSAIDWSAWALAETKEIPICPVNARVHKARTMDPKTSHENAMEDTRMPKNAALRHPQNLCGGWGRWEAP